MTKRVRHQKTTLTLLTQLRLSLLDGGNEHISSSYSLLQIIYKYKQQEVC